MVNTVRKSRKDRTLRPVPPSLLAAARRTLLIRGVRRTSMGDIAEAAGIPRPTLYEYVAGRDDLIDMVLIERLRKISEGLAPIAESAASFEEAIVETSVEAIRATRADAEITNIFTTAPNRRVHQVLEGPNPEVEKISAAFLAPLFRRGSASGELRSDVSQETLINWVRAVYTAHIIREELDLEETRMMMRKFLVPALVAHAGLPAGESRTQPPGASARVRRPRR